MQVMQRSQRCLPFPQIRVPHTSIICNIRRRRYTSKVPSRDDLLAILRRNPELDAQDAKNELRWIEHAVNSDIHLKDRVDEGSLTEFAKRRGRGEPLQYILGTTDFGPLTLHTTPPTLIPRPETAHMIARLCDHISNNLPSSPSKGLRVLDLCTGSGCIALLVKHHLQQHAHLVGVDISPEAIALSKKNGKYAGLDIDFRLGDLWRDTYELANDGLFDMVVSNPPYIPLDEWKRLDKGVKEYEDPLALIGDPGDVPSLNGVADTQEGERARGMEGRRGDGKGLSFYRRIAALLPKLLTSREALQKRGLGKLPRVAVEIGFGQARDVEEIFMSESESQIRRIEVWPDQYGVNRMVVGW